MRKDKLGFCEQPIAKEGTKFRVVGPTEKNGMQTWTIYEIGKGGIADKQVTPDLFSVDEVQSRLKDLLVGKKTVWANSIPFTRKRIGE